MRSMAGPLRTAWVMAALTDLAPFSMSASAALHNDPPVIADIVDEQAVFVAHVPRWTFHDFALIGPVTTLINNGESAVIVFCHGAGPSRFHLHPATPPANRRDLQNRAQRSAWQKDGRQEC